MSLVSDLAVETVQDPQSAARRIMKMRFGRNELYTGLIAVAAVNALLASGGATLGPPIDPMALEAIPMLALLQRPLVLFLLIAGGLIVMVHALFWAGRAMGGDGELTDMLALLTWLQALRAAAQGGIIVLDLVFPLMAGLVALAIAVFAFWLLLHFISAALQFDSLFRALGVLVAVTVGLLFGMTIIVTAMGVSAGGMSSV